MVDEIYPFDRVVNFIEYYKKKKIKYYDFGFGNPKEAPHKKVLEACTRAIMENKNKGYPTAIGEIYVRKKISSWMKKRFNIDINPLTQISVTNGAKGGILRFSLTILKPGDYVLIPTPSYPIITTAAIKAHAKIYFMPLKEENQFLPDYDAVPKTIIKKTKILWINFPNNPTGAEVSKKYLAKLVHFCQENKIILAADEVYIDLYSKQKPHSVLEISDDNVVSFFSLTKSHSMADYRIGWVAGDKNLIQKFQREESWMESGVPSFIQHALVEALKHDDYVKKLRREYIKRNMTLSTALSSIGLQKPAYRGCFYIWQKVPKGQTGEEFYNKLLNLNIISIPGEWLTETINGKNAGKNYIRFAMVSSLKKTIEAAKLIKENRKMLLEN